MKRALFWLPGLAFATAMAVPEEQWPDFLQPDLQLGAKYHLIQEGMTKGEVHAILGPPTEPSAFRKASAIWADIIRCP